MIDHAMLSDDYEIETRQIMAKVLKEGDSFLIAGAHQGGLSAYAAALVGPTGTVYGFEPEKDNYSILTETVKPFGNVKTYPYALGDRDSEAALFINKDNSGGHSLFDVGKHPDNVKTRENPSFEMVAVKTVDSFLEDEDLSRLKLILFDMEGAELSALRGAINTIVDNEVPYIITEINDFALQQCNSTQMSLRGFMDMYGYECFVITSEGCKDTNKKTMITCEADGKPVVFNVLFSRKGKV